MTKIGHNSGGVDSTALVAFVDRLEKLEEEKAAVASDMKEVMAEAKGGGFSPKILRKIIARRKRDAAEVAEEEALLAMYLAAIIG